MLDCPRGGKWFGCKFKARYDEGVLSDDVLSKIAVELGRGDMLGHEVSAMKQKTYVRDICVRCGITIERIPS
jgi:hypothetical protein